MTVYFGGKLHPPIQKEKNCILVSFFLSHLPSPLPSLSLQTRKRLDYHLEIDSFGSLV